MQRAATSAASAAGTPNSLRTPSATYAYNSTTSGFLESSFDSTAGTFTATRDAEGKPLTETYPNGMTATYTYNEAGAAIGLEYVKTTHCAEEKGKCTWFKESIVPTIYGETFSDTNSFAQQEYAYNDLGWLTRVHETPTGGACQTRNYTYDEEGDRTSYATAPAKSDGKCGTKSTLISTHAYDTANELIDAGIEYEPLGNMTKVPAADASGAEAGEATELDSSYYVDGQLDTQTQDGKTLHYTYDPEGRIFETEANGKVTVSHYAASGGAAVWTSESNGEWTRQIPGIDGMLDAIQHNGETPVIQIHDLEGDVVATAEDNNEKETKLLSTYRSTEFGVPTTTNPPRFSWLGAAAVSSELPSGVVADGGPTYVPTIAMSLQAEGVQPPENTPTEYTSATEPWVAESLAHGAAELLLQYREAQEALAKANPPPGTGPPGGEGGGPSPEPPGEENNPSEEFNSPCAGCGGTASDRPVSEIGCHVYAAVYTERWSELLLQGEVSCPSVESIIEIQFCRATFGEDSNSYVTTNCSPGPNKYSSEKSTSVFRIGGFVACEGDATYAAWVWGAVLHDGVWYSSARLSRKVKNACVEGGPPSPSE